MSLQGGSNWGRFWPGNSIEPNEVWGRIAGIGNNLDLNSLVGEVLANY